MEVRVALVKSREEILAVCAQGPEALVTLVTTLPERLAHVDARLAAVEARLAKDSHHSGRPPSSDPVGRLRSLRGKSGKSGERPGGQPGHEGRTLAQRAAPDVVLTHAPTQCHACGAWTRGAFPADVRTTAQYGREVQALAVYQTAHRLLPVGRASEMRSHLPGQPVSVATGLFVRRRQWWLHTASNPMLTLHAVHRDRGRGAHAAIGLLPAYRGTVVHDGYRAYGTAERPQYPCRHALCGDHLLREPTFLAEEYQLRFRTPTGAETFCALRGYVVTTRERGRTPLGALRDLFAGHPFIAAVPE
jgi:transposase